MKWSQLSKKHKKHLQEHGVTSLESFIRTRERQLEFKKKTETDFPDGPSGEPCWKCFEIAKELGVCQ